MEELNLPLLAPPRTPAFIAFGAVLIGLPLACARETRPRPHDTRDWGTVDFPTSCRPQVQGAFNRAVAMLHSFEFAAARSGFEAVAARDPGCAMAHWGLWRESIQTNLAAKGAARAAGGWTEAAHTLDYLIYAHLQRAQDGAAAVMVEELLALGAEHPDEYGVLEHVADIKARWLMEWEGWPEYRTIALDTPLVRYPRFEATLRFARAVGAARSGDPSSARVEAGRFPDLIAALSGTERYYAGTVAVWQGLAEAWIAYADGAPQSALRLMEAAAELDDNTAYVGSFESGPDALAQSREHLGDLPLELGRPADALGAYEAALATSPGRFNGLVGAGRAAELADNREKAATYYRELLRMTSEADTERPGLERAKAFFEGRGPG